MDKGLVQAEVATSDKIYNKKNIKIKYNKNNIYYIYINNIYNIYIIIIIIIIIIYNEYY